MTKNLCPFKRKAFQPRLVINIIFWIHTSVVTPTCGVFGGDVCGFGPRDLNVSWNLVDSGGWAWSLCLDRCTGAIYCRDTYCCGCRWWLGCPNLSPAVIFRDTFRSSRSTVRTVKSMSLPRDANSAVAEVQLQGRNEDFHYCCPEIWSKMPLSLTII